MKLIIDGNGFAYRSFHSEAEPIINARGQDLTIIYWVILMLRGLLTRHEKTDEVIFCWDSGKSKSRLSLLPDYKKNRDDQFAAKQQLHEQCQILKKQLFPFLGIKQFEYEGIEADDVIAVLSAIISKNPRNPQDVTIVSGDKDFLQLINPYCSIYRTRLKQTINYDNFEERIGIPQEHFLDFLCLNGDVADDIPGIKGISDSTIKKLIKAYGSYEDILKSQEEISMLINTKANKTFSKRMALLFSQETKTRYLLNKQLIKLGILLTRDEKAKIITDYFEQDIPVDEKRVLSFFEEHQLLEFARDIKRITFMFNYIKHKNNAMAGAR